MAIKNPPPAPKHSGQNVHPETTKPASRAGVPGSERSKLKSAADPRNNHDKDGNEQQLARKASKR